MRAPARADVAAVGRGRARPRRAAGAGGGDPSDRGPRRGRRRPRRPDPAAAGDAAARPRRHPSLGGRAVLPADAGGHAGQGRRCRAAGGLDRRRRRRRPIGRDDRPRPVLGRGAVRGDRDLADRLPRRHRRHRRRVPRYASFVLFAFLVVQLTTTAAQLLARVVRVLVLSSTGRGGDGSRRCRPARRPPGRRPDRGIRTTSPSCW